MQPPEQPPEQPPNPPPARRPRLRPWMIGALVGAVFAVRGVVNLVQDLNRTSDPEARAAQIEDGVLAKSPGLAAVAHKEPALWAEQHRILVASLRDHPNDFTNADAAAWSAPLNARLKHAAAGADDDAVLAIYRAKLQTIQKLQSVSPDACKAFLDLDYASLNKLPDDLKGQIRTADQPIFTAYEQGADRPAPKPLSEAQFDTAFERARAATDIPIDDKDIDALSGQGSPAAQCDATLRIMRVITQAPAQDGAPLARYLLLQP